MTARLSLIALFLLATLPAVAQNVQPGWTADPRTGCRVWNASPQPNETVAWSGACGDGMAQGRGRLEWFENAILTEHFEGEYRNGKKHGRGVKVWANGNRHDGEWRDDKRNGRGVLVFGKGSRYNGDRYDGEWRDDNQHGRGIYVWASGTRYDGEWRDGNMHGRGVEVWANGDRYDGEWRNDKAHGSGTKTLADGRTYTGTWTNGCFRQGDRWSTAGTTAKECGFK